MKRLIAILLCSFLCLTLAACSPGGYLNSTDGDITVSLPEKVEPDAPEFTEEQKLILGKWDLVSITVDGTANSYTDSYYLFEESGRFTAHLDGTSEAGSFSFTDSNLKIRGEIMTYTIENDILTITTSSNKIHLLTRAAVDEAEELTGQTQPTE